MRKEEKPKLYVKDWGSFQHYKDRSPPWIKLHKTLLDNYEYHCLHVASKALAPLIWLLASESQDGAIEYDPKKLCFRLHISENELNFALRDLIYKGFVIDASNALAECKQDAMLETETETYKEETEKEVDARESRLAQSAPTPSVPKPPKPKKEKIILGAAELLAAVPGLSEKTALDWLAVRKEKRAVLTQSALDGVANEAAKAGLSVAEAIKFAAQKGWRGFDVGWYQNAIGASTNFSGDWHARPRNIHEDRANAIAELTGRAQGSRIIDIEDGSAVALDRPPF